MTGRIVLVHWEAGEAEERADRLRSLGYDVACHSDSRANPRSLAERPPDAFVIDLTRLPSQGRELGGWLRRSKATRPVPLVFVGGDSEKIERTQALLPDAVFSDWENAAEAVAGAMAVPVADPRVPGAMDAYAGRSLSGKLGIREGSTVLLLDAPIDFEEAFCALPNGVQLSRLLSVGDVVLLFVESKEGLAQNFADAADRMTRDGQLWILWPKKASGIRSDLTQSAVRGYGLEHGFVDYKIASVDATWSGLCFASRPAESQERTDDFTR
jgi:CheY-like chemotaxis protein